MSVQAQRDISLHPLVLGGRCITRRVTVKQDASRSGAMVLGTLCSYDSTNAKWVPFSDETATDGTQIPCGILYQALTEAAIKAGDIEDVTMIVSDCILNEDLVTIESSKTKNTIITVPTNLKQAVWQVMGWNGLILVDTIEGTSYEAA